MFESAGAGKSLVFATTFKSHRVPSDWKLDEDFPEWNQRGGRTLLEASGTSQGSDEALEIIKFWRI